MSAYIYIIDRALGRPADQKTDMCKPESIVN